MSTFTGVIQWGGVELNYEVDVYQPPEPPSPDGEEPGCDMEFEVLKLSVGWEEKDALWLTDSTFIDDIVNLITTDIEEA